MSTPGPRPQTAWIVQRRAGSQRPCTHLRFRVQPEIGTCPVHRQGWRWQLRLHTRRRRGGTRYDWPSTAPISPLTKEERDERRVERPLTPLITSAHSLHPRRRQLPVHLRPQGQPAIVIPEVHRPAIRDERPRQPPGPCPLPRGRPDHLAGMSVVTPRSASTVEVVLKTRVGGTRTCLVQPKGGRGC